METTDLNKYLCELFEAHDVPFHIHNEWVVPYGDFPAIRATWFQKEGNGVFEVEVLLEGNRIINECFAGFGNGQEGILSGLENFCVNSFHVFLSAFWKRHEEEQVKLETWSIGGETYQAFIGNFGTRAAAGVVPKIPEKLFEQIEKAISQESLDEKISWFRIFVASVSGQLIFEALKDNQEWKNGLSVLQSLKWEKEDRYYSVRNFIVIKKHKKSRLFNFFQKK